MSKARKEYECFECKRNIAVGEEYERKTRYDNPDDRKYGGLSKGFQKCICKKCVSENKYSYIDEKYNKILEDSTVIKFGQYIGKKWDLLDDDYLIFIYSNIKVGIHRKEIVTEFNRRLNLNKSCEIKSLNFEERKLKLEKLKEEYIKNETAIYKSLSIYMEKEYKKILEFGGVRYCKRKNDNYEYWYIEKSDGCFEYIRTKTIIALYNRGLLKPVEFTDNLLDFRPIKYVPIAKDITPKKSARLTKRTIIEWAKENDLGIYESIAWKTNWRDADIIKYGYEFSFNTSIENNPCGYSISCYGTLNDIKKYNSLELVKKIKEEVYQMEKETGTFMNNIRCQVFKDKYAITDTTIGYGLFGRTTTPFFDNYIKDFVYNKHGFN